MFWLVCLASPVLSFWTTRDYTESITQLQIFEVRHALIEQNMKLDRSTALRGLSLEPYFKRVFGTPDCDLIESDVADNMILILELTDIPVTLAFLEKASSIAESCGVSIEDSLDSVLRAVALLAEQMMHEHSSTEGIVKLAELLGLDRQAIPRLEQRLSQSSSPDLAPFILAEVALQELSSPDLSEYLMRLVASSPSANMFPITDRAEALIVALNDSVRAPPGEATYRFQLSFAKCFEVPFILSERVEASIRKTGGVSEAYRILNSLQAVLEPCSALISIYRLEFHFSNFIQTIELIKDGETQALDQVVTEHLSEGLIDRLGLPQELLISGELEEILEYLHSLGSVSDPESDEEEDPLIYLEFLRGRLAIKMDIEQGEANESAGEAGALSESEMYRMIRQAADDLDSVHMVGWQHDERDDSVRRSIARPELRFGSVSRGMSVSRRVGGLWAGSMARPDDREGALGGTENGLNIPCDTRVDIQTQTDHVDSRACEEEDEAAEKGSNGGGKHGQKRTGRRSSQKKHQKQQQVATEPRGNSSSHLSGVLYGLIAVLTLSLTGVSFLLFLEKRKNQLKVEPV